MRGIGAVGAQEQLDHAGDMLFGRLLRLAAAIAEHGLRMRLAPADQWHLPAS